MQYNQFDTLRYGAINILLLGLLVISLGACAAKAETAPASAAQMATGTAASTSAGTTFTVPIGWTTRSQEQFLLLSPPEADLSLALIDLEAKDAEATIAVCDAYQPDFKRPLRLTSPQAPHDGWEERKAFIYEVSPNEQREIEAFVWRAGSERRQAPPDRA